MRWLYTAVACAILVTCSHADSDVQQHPHSLKKKYELVLKEDVHREKRAVAAAAGAGWMAKTSGFLKTAGSWANGVGAVTQTVSGIVGIVTSIQQLSQAKQQAKIQNAQFEKQMALQTEQLCLTICVTEWQPWTMCTKRCGAGGKTTRTRTRFEAPRCKGKPCPHRLKQTADCNIGCPNGGQVLSTGACKCQPGIAGECCENQVTCAFPGKPRFGSMEGTSPFKYASVVNFECDEGYALTGEETILCKADGKWTSPTPKCEHLTCESTDALQHGRILNNKGQYYFGEEVMFVCDRGFEIMGPEKRICINRGGVGGWGSFMPLCLPITCDDPDLPLYGEVNGNNFTLGAAVSFWCHDGFRLLGSRNRTCLRSGKWSGHEPKCEMIRCEAPLTPKHGSLVREREEYRFGQSVTFECDQGYRLEGQATARCKVDPLGSPFGLGGVWTSAEPTCTAAICGDPGVPDFGAKDGTVYYYPHNVSYTCSQGHVLRGDEFIHCAEDGHWTAQKPTCETCTKGHYKSSSVNKEECKKCPDHSDTPSIASTSVEQCQCVEGYTGPSGGPCTEIVCPVLESPQNGTVSDCGHKYNSVCEFSCHEGYIIETGSLERTCQETAEWSGKQPVCVACPLHTFKSDERSCLPCPPNARTAEEASQKKDCKCMAGYQGPPGGPCSDVNECEASDGHGDCSDVCNNIEGGYICACSIPGYVLENDGHNCKKAKSCRNLTEEAPDNGGLVCHWFYEENSQQCSVKCNPGYDFPSRTNNYETCGSTTGFEWTHTLREVTIQPCIEEFFPGIRLEGNSSYFVRQCSLLTEEEKNQVKQDFAQLLTDDGICRKRETQVCNMQDVGIICGKVTKRRRKRGGMEEVQEATFAFNITALNLTDPEFVCPFLRIPPASCDTLWRDAVKRFRLASIKATKRQLEHLYRDRSRTKFQSGDRHFMPIRDPLKTSDVIVECEAGEIGDEEACVPCVGGSYLSAEDNDCIPCAEGTYQPNVRATECITCPPGTTSNSGAKSCHDCPKGKYGINCKETCQPCDHGTCHPSTGRCVCSSGYTGPRCNQDINSCHEDSCYASVTCNDIPAPGIGFRCGPCPNGLTGNGAKCFRIAS